MAVSALSSLLGAGRKGLIMKIEGKDSARNGAPRKAYVKPEVHSEKMFETAALACGKCTSGPVSQNQCGTLLANS